MNFENQNGLTVDGLAGTQVWSALLADLATSKANANPYDYVLVSKQLPENLTLYENGAPVMSRRRRQYRVRRGPTPSTAPTRCSST